MDENLKRFLGDLSVLDKIYDLARIVDPNRKEVISYHNNNVEVDALRCFDFWNKNSICDNCVSMRAYNDNSTYVKIEYTEDKIYVITAVPYQLGDRRIVIELLKDTTKSMLYSADENQGSKSTEIHSVIDQLNNIAFTDSLTGLFNRRFISEKLPVDLMNTCLLSRQLSIIMIDSDNFKDVNDNYGHIAGDKALKSLADTLSLSKKRDSDWIARYGGDEFLVCMPGADIDVALATAECMRKAVEDTKIQYEDKVFSMTASFGVYSIKPNGAENVDDLLKHADDKLYMAKKNGRNRVEFQVTN